MRNKVRDGNPAGPGGGSTAILLASVLRGPFIRPGLLTSQRLGGLRRTWQSRDCFFPYAGSLLGDSEVGY